MTIGISEQKRFKLEFSNRVIEHLGIKLYQNKPTNVIAEFVSNAWDADAENVDIDIRASVEASPEIIITDDGKGMTRDELTDHFLIIGRNRRDNPRDKTARKQRSLMGRKGIGKLAGFGIAKIVDVLSFPNPLLRDDSSENSVFWLRFMLDELLLEESHERGEYFPIVIADRLSLEEFINLPEYIVNSAFLDRWIANIQQGKGGTCVRLSNTTLKRTVPPEQLLRSMGQRFTVSMLRPDFSVKVNDKMVEPKYALPQFHDFEQFGAIDSMITELVDIGGEMKEIRYWAKFVSLQDSDWPLENAGVGIYAHGKIAQDRPFFFGVKGKEIFSRYLYSVIEADWLDELEQDVVSTDRRSIDWNTDATESFYQWGEKKVLGWLDAFKKWRQEQPRKEIIERIRNRNTTKKLTGIEEEALANLLSEVLPNFGNDEDAKDKTIISFTDAWTHEPTRKLTEQLWKSVFSENMIEPSRFVTLIDELKKSLIPEALGLAVTVAQRISAITAMRNLIVFEKTETNLQSLIEEFPWLLGQQGELLTADKSLRTLIEQKFTPDLAAGEWPLNTTDRKLRPDFVFLSNGDNKNIVVIELKGPEGDKALQPGEYEQLAHYLRIISRVYPEVSSEIRGVLIGHELGSFYKSDHRITIKTWSDVLQEARIQHLDYLKSLLAVSNPTADDVRLKQIADFGGPETVELLTRMRANGGLTLPQAVLEALELSPTPIRS